MASNEIASKKIIKTWRKSKVVAILTDLHAHFLIPCMNKDPHLLLYHFIICYNNWTKRDKSIHNKTCSTFTKLHFIYTFNLFLCSVRNYLSLFPSGLVISTMTLNQMRPGWARRVELPSQGAKGAAAPLPRAAELLDQGKPSHSLLLPTALTRLTPAAEH